MFAMNRPRMLVAVIVGVNFAAMLALAAFSAAASAHQEGTNAEQEGASAKEGPDAGGKEVTIEDHAWSSYHWSRKDSTKPLSLTLDDNVSSAWDSYLTTASSDWSTPPNSAWPDVLDTSILANQMNTDCTPTSGKVEVCNKDYGATGWSGLAQIWVTRGKDKHITAGTAKMNDRYFGSDPVKRAHVMCQEVGHTFGLGHTSEDGSSQQTCMDYSSDLNSQHPNQHDYEQLQIIYSHQDGTRTTASKLPAAAKRGNFDTRNSWGQLKHRDEDGKHAVFERQFSDGTKLVTFVEVEDEGILEGQQGQPQEEKKEKKQQDQ